MRPLRVLHIEDSPPDTKLIELALRRAKYDVSSQRVETAPDMQTALRSQRWDIVLSDYTMPNLDAFTALKVLKESGQDIPFIIVSGSIGEETAVQALKEGAGDFIVKTNLARLAPAIERELQDAKTRQEKREAFRALEESVRARDEFLSIASHELKTPLAALRLQLQGILRRKSAELHGQVATPTLRDKVQAADRNAERLATLVDKLLEITRLTSGKLDLDPEHLNLTKLVQESLEAFEQIARRAGSTLQLTGSADVWGEWDRDRLRSVVDNLVDNALKYGRGAPVQVSLSESGGEAVLVVQDRGIGISEGDQRRIFERFERAVPEQHFGGFGLGLWLTQKVVAAHGGSISVASVKDQGSTFTVVLPQKRRES